MPGEKPKKSSDEPKKQPGDQPEPKKSKTPEERRRNLDAFSKEIEAGMSQGIHIPGPDEPDAR